MKEKKKEKEKIILANGSEMKILVSYSIITFISTKMWPTFPLPDHALSAFHPFLPLHSIMDSIFFSSPTFKRNFTLIKY